MSLKLRLDILLLLNVKRNNFQDRPSKNEKFIIVIPIQSLRDLSQSVPIIKYFTASIIFKEDFIQDQ